MKDKLEILLSCMHQTVDIIERSNIKCNATIVNQCDKDDKRMFEFYESKDKDEMLEFFKNTKYARKISEINPDLVEKNIYQISYLSARTSLQNAQTAPVALYNFLILCETEAQNLVSIIEGIRYKASSGYIEKLLLM